MSGITIQDLIRVSLPDRGKRGWVAMLECYLDDSGTHDGAKILVWGGVVGDHRFFSELESLWRAMLQSPCDNKPPIKCFHSSHLLMGVGEFEGYNQAERDATRYNFRKLIVDCGLSWLAYGISMEAWARSAPPIMQKNFTPESLVFGAVTRDLCKSAIKADMPMAFFFDQGRDHPDLRAMVDVARNISGIGDLFASSTFTSVASNIGLQAADLVAHEVYQHYQNMLKKENAKPSAHLERLVNDVHWAADGFYGDEQIIAAWENAESVINSLDGD